MHSIFGTEIASLPPNLERYYSRYFDNRSAVVQQAEQYQKAFRSREAAVKAYDRQLANLQKQIETNEATLQAKARELGQLRTQLNQYRSTNKADQYNALVKTYNNQAHSYNALLATTRSQISRFNSIVQKRNALVVEEQQLVKQLSGSNLPTVQ
jgi:chromosome segregation ATPase